MSHKPYMEKRFSSNLWWTHILLSVFSKLKSAVLCKADSHTLGTYSASDSSPQGAMPDSLGMRVTFALTAWMLSVVSSSSSPANTLPDIKNEDFIKDCVRMHNKFRSAVTPAASDMLYMVRKLPCLQQKSIKHKGCGLIWVVSPWNPVIIFFCDESMQ